jgi:hypothetical protein
LTLYPGPRSKMPFRAIDRTGGFLVLGRTRIAEDAKNGKKNDVSKWSGFGAVGAAIGVALSWLCCLPFAAALGAGVTAAGAALTPYQPYLALVSVSLLGVALVQTIRSRACDDGESCGPWSQGRRWLFLAVISVAVILLITIPYWSASLIYWNLGAGRLNR